MAESTDLPDRLPAINAGVEVVAFPGALVAFDVRNRTAHELVGTPAVVFDACREQLRTTQLVDEFVEAGIGVRDHVVGLIGSVLADLAGLGLLEGCSAPQPPPCLGCAEASTGRFRRRGR